MNLRCLLILAACAAPVLAQSDAVSSSPAPEEEVGVGSAEPMPEGIARSRIEHAMDHATPFEERQGVLAEVVARCEDQSLRSIAAYNLGTALIRRSPGDAAVLGDAVEWLRQADSAGSRPELRVRARDSIGHAWYLLAQASPGDTDAVVNPADLGQMLEGLVEKLSQLEESAGAFRSASDVDRGYRPALENLERVRREIQRLREQIDSLRELIEQQRQMQEQQREQQRQAAEKLEELAEQQQDESEQNSRGADQSSDQQQADQQELSDETRAEQDALNQQSAANEPMQQVQDQLENARNAQRRAEEALERGDAEEAAAAQEEAAEALRDAAETMREMAEGEGEEGEGGDSQAGEGTPQQESQQQPSQEAQEPSEQISEIARQLLEKERRERERRQARRTPMVVPVERDW